MFLLKCFSERNSGALLVHSTDQKKEDHEKLSSSDFTNILLKNSNSNSKFMNVCISACLALCRIINVRHKTYSKITYCI